MKAFECDAVMRPLVFHKFMTMAANPSADGYRKGKLRAGTREFLTLNGTIVERFVNEVDDLDSGDVGRIELVTAFVGVAEELE